MQMSGALKYYTNLTPVRWDWIQPGQVPLLRERARAEGYQWFALLLPFENEELPESVWPWGWRQREDGNSLGECHPRGGSIRITGWDVVATRRVYFGCVGSRSVFGAGATPRSR